MTGRPGFYGGSHGDSQDRDAEGFQVGPGGVPVIRLGDPNPSPYNPAFDPVWGTLGAPAQANDPWLTTPTEEEPEGQAVDVEIFGDGFEISGQLYAGQFERLSDWMNMQAGFIQVRNAWHAHLGQTDAPPPDQRKGTLWVKLDQIVLVAERTPTQQTRPGAPVVQKQKRKVSIITPGYNLMGSLYVHAYGSMKQFLESPDPHFLPITDLTVRWLSDSAMVARFPFALINRDQLVTMFDEASAPAGDAAGIGGEEDDMPLRRRFGAA